MVGPEPTATTGSSWPHPVPRGWDLLPKPFPPGEGAGRPHVTSGCGHTAALARLAWRRGSSWQGAEAWRAARATSQGGPGGIGLPALCVAGPFELLWPRYPFGSLHLGCAVLRPVVWPQGGTECTRPAACPMPHVPCPVHRALCPVPATRLPLGTHPCRCAGAWAMSGGCGCVWRFVSGADSCDVIGRQCWGGSPAQAGGRGAWGSRVLSNEEGALGIRWRAWCSGHCGGPVMLLSQAGHRCAVLCTQSSPEPMTSPAGGGGACGRTDLKGRGQRASVPAGDPSTSISLGSRWAPAPARPVLGGGPCPILGGGACPVLSTWGPSRHQWGPHPVLRGGPVPSSARGAPSRPKHAGRRQGGCLCLVAHLLPEEEGRKPEKYH